MIKEQTQVTVLDSSEAVNQAGTEVNIQAPEGASEEEKINWSNMTTAEQLDVFERVNANALSEMSFEQALAEAVVAESDNDVVSKDKLVGIPFIIRRIRINQGNFGPFVSLTVTTKNNETVVINDGSTGVARQLIPLIREHGLDRFILIKGGLRKSTYYVDNETKKPVGKQPRDNSFAASTYYFDYNDPK